MRQTNNFFKSSAIFHLCINPKTNNFFSIFGEIHSFLYTN